MQTLHSIWVLGIEIQNINKEFEKGVCSHQAFLVWQLDRLKVGWKNSPLPPISPVKFLKTEHRIVKATLDGLIAFDGGKAVKFQKCDSPPLYSKNKRHTAFVPQRLMTWPQHVFALRQIPETQNQPKRLKVWATLGGRGMPAPPP